MTQEEKQLLLKDLCWRLTNELFCWVNDGDEPVKLIGITTNRDAPLELYDDHEENESIYYTIENIKPYLRPMPSMTEEEKRFYKKYFNWYEQPLEDMVEFIDWLNAHHFDYRGLIPMGLALPAKPGMYDSN